MSTGGDPNLEIRLSLDNSAAVQANAAFLSAARKAEDAARQLARTQEDEARRAARSSEEAQRRAIGQVLSDAKAAEQQQEDLARRLARAQEDAATKLKRAHQDAMRAQTHSFDVLQSSGTAAAGVVKGLAVQFLGLAAPAAIIGTLASDFKQFHQTVLDSTKVLDSYREAVAAVAELKGLIGQSTAAVGQDVAFRAKSLQTQAESIAFQEAAFGVGESSIDVAGGPKRLISRDDFNKLLERSAALAVSVNADSRAIGALAGIIPQTLGKRTTADEAFRELARLQQTFRPGGADISTLAQQYAKVATPAIAGGAVNKEDAAALLSAFSTVNPGAPGDTLQQFLRATIGAAGRGRKVKGLEGEYAESQGEYLKGLGVTDQSTAIQIGTAVAKDFAAQERAAASRGERFNASAYLQQRGYGDQEARNALTLFAGATGLARTGQLASFQRLAAQAPTLAEAQAPIERFQRFDPRAETRRRAVAGETAQVALAAGPAGEYRRVTEAIFNQWLAEQKVGGTYEEYTTSYVPWKGIQLKSEAARRIRESELAVGIDKPVIQSGFGQPIEYGREWQERITAIKERGGKDPFEEQNRATIDLGIRSLDLQSKSEQHLADIAQTLKSANAAQAAPPRPRVAAPAVGGVR